MQGRLGTGVICIAGLVGSASLSVGGLLVAYMPPSSVAQLALLHHLRGMRGHIPMAWVLIFGGLVLLTGAWLALGRRVRERREGAAIVRRVSAVWCLPLLLSPPMFSRDAWSYVADGYLTGHGRSPYLTTPSVLPHFLLETVSERWRHTPAPYGPVTLLWGGVWSQLTADPYLLMLAQRGLAIIGLLILAYAVPKLASHAGADPATATWLVIASPFVLVNGIADAHNDLVMAGLMVAALVAARERGWLLGAVLAGAAAAVKVPGGAVALGVVLLTLPVGASLRARAVRTVGVGAVAALVVAALGWIGGLGLGWIGALGVPVVNLSPLSLTSDLGHLARLLFGASAHVPWLDYVRLAGVVVLAVLSIGALVVGPTGARAVTYRVVALVALAFTLLSPVVRAWYLFWCIPLLACCALPPRANRVLVWAVVTLGVLTPLGPTLHVKGGAMMVAAGAALAVVAGLALHDWVSRPSTLARHGHQWS